MAESEYDRFRAGLERFLELAAALKPGMQDRIRQAISLRHDDAKAREQINGTDAEKDGDHILNHLAAARETLKPSEEAQLAALAMARLADPNQHPKSRGDP